MKNRDWDSIKVLITAIGLLALKLIITAGFMYAWLRIAVELVSK